MSKASEKSAKVASSKETAPLAWSKFFGHLGMVCSLLMLLTILVGLAWGTRPLSAYAAKQPLPGAAAHESLPPKPTKVVINWPLAGKNETGQHLTWIPDAQREELQLIASDALAGDIERFSSDPIERVGKAMSTSGWFVGRPRVQRMKGGEIHVGGVWRVPAALVRKGETSQLISWDGLPMPVKAAAGEEKFPVIVSPALSAPRTAAGTIDFDTAWAGEDIAASLELLALVLRQPWASQVEGIDAQQFSADRSLTILTTMNTRVVWGGRVSRPALGEVSSEQKLAHIQKLFNEKQRIDAGFPLIYVNNNKLQIDISATAQAYAQVQAQAVQEGLPESRLPKHPLPVDTKLAQNPTPAR
jgi:hypothetical protein